MKIIEAGFEFLTDVNEAEAIQKIAQAARVCYKSEHLATEKTNKNLITACIKSKHGAVLEHYSFSVKFTVDRGVSHEIVRHRVASYCQESTRYCNYSNDKFENQITVIKPCFLTNVIPNVGWDLWKTACEQAEKSYFDLLNHGLTPQEARAVLPNSLKTEIVMTANIREWRHFLELRCSKAAHPQIREVAIQLLEELKVRLPLLFNDITY